MLISLGAQWREEQDTTGMTIMHSDMGDTARDILKSVSRAVKS